MSINESQLQSKVPHFTCSKNIHFTQLHVSICHLLNCHESSAERLFTNMWRDWNVVGFCRNGWVTRHSCLNGSQAVGLDVSVAYSNLNLIQVPHVIVSHTLPQVNPLDVLQKECVSDNFLMDLQMWHVISLQFSHLLYFIPWFFLFSSWNKWNIIIKATGIQ